VVAAIHNQEGTMMLKKTTICAALLLTAACAGEDASDAGMVQEEQDMDVAPPVQETPVATAELRDAQGASVGTATLEEGATGVRIALDLTGLPEGPHGFHIHQTGECTAPTFASAGGHFNPTGAQHGLDNPQGPHAGDMQNLDVAAGGAARIATDNERITLAPGPNSVLDSDGSAIVIHAAADDNVTDPSGNSGDRIACGVIAAG
jgi:Cu-Zn family superoxide dismutase